MTYGYDANGDLVSFTDREENTTHFTYYEDQPHLLESLIDPRGIRPIRNEYYDDGRIKSHTDAFGKTIRYDYDAIGRQEVVTRSDGRAAGAVLRRARERHQGDRSERKEIDRTFDARNNRLTRDAAARCRAP